MELEQGSHCDRWSHWRTKLALAGIPVKQSESKVEDEIAIVEYGEPIQVGQWPRPRGTEKAA